MSGEFHIVPHLSAGVLIGTDLLFSHHVLIDMAAQLLYLHRSLPIPVRSFRAPPLRLSLKSVL